MTPNFMSLKKIHISFQNESNSYSKYLLPEAHLSDNEINYAIEEATLFKNYLDIKQIFNSCIKNLQRYKNVSLPPSKRIAIWRFYI